MLTTLWWRHGAYKADPPPPCLLTPEIIAKETPALLKNNLRLAGLIAESAGGGFLVAFNMSYIERDE